MPTDKKLNTLVLNVMTEEQYNSVTKNEDELYLTPDDHIEVKLYTHNISLNYMGQSYLYMTLISSSNTSISTLIELVSLLGSPNRYISCSGTIYVNQKFFPISCLFWQGSLSKSYILYTDTVNGERSSMTSGFGTENTTVSDVVKPIWLVQVYKLM